MQPYPGAIKSKLPNTGTTIFAVMSKLAQDTGAINLSQGFPDFNCHEELIALVSKYMNGNNNQYAPMAGMPVLREAIVAKTKELYSASYDVEKEVTVTAGATQAIFTAVAAVVEEGDEVLVFEPAYDSYIPAIELNGGEPVFYQMEAPDYAIDWQKVRKLVNQRTKMIIINSPHNPSGSILTAADMKELEKITKNTDIIILSDEVYEHIIFEGYEHQSVARYPSLAERAFVISSFGKVYHTTGWKMGYCLAPENLMKEFRKVHQFNVFSVNTPIQLAYAEFMQKKEHYLGLADFYQRKRDFFNNLLRDSRFTLKPASGTYFQMLDYSNITDEKDTDYATRLTREHGVAAIPPSVFYHNHMDQKVLRFCFAKSDETLEQAAEKLCRI